MAALESLKEFWDAMDEIDEKTWVLEPENPTRSATMRRIAIGRKIGEEIKQLLKVEMLIILAFFT